jgi:cytochrome c oxidase cbb3-type subunit 1
MEGLMWRAYNEYGFLEYSFVESVVAAHPYYVIRAIGGLLYLTGTLVMAYNLWRTIRGDVPAAERAAPAAAVAQVA